jgi:hypothetical protein
VFVDVSPDDSYQEIKEDSQVGRLEAGSEERKLELDKLEVGRLESKKGDEGWGGGSFRDMIEQPIPTQKRDVSQGEGEGRVEVYTDQYGVESISYSTMDSSRLSVGVVPISGGFEGTSNSTQVCYN